MHINTDALNAFLKVQQFESFTLAAQNLGISQSALSQKISRLEGLLQTTLFIRGLGELKLTSSGEKLLIFSKQQLEFESSFISQFNQYQDKPAGVLRIAGFSSITRSVLIPCLSSITLKNPMSQIEFSSHEVNNLESVLRKNQADIILTDYKVNITGIESTLIGREEYVVIEPKSVTNIPNLFLDHGPHDNATESFFNYQEKKIEYRRGFMGDVYGIIDGVELGLGRAVMSKHLVAKNKKLIIKKFKKRYFREVYMSYYRQSFHSPLHGIVTEKLLAYSGKYLI
jgi:DNA-binding transcriptional LysR family regulator